MADWAGSPPVKVAWFPGPAGAGWVEAGKIKYREEMIDGLEQAPSAFVGLLRGEAFGKRVIRVGPDD